MRPCLIFSRTSGKIALHAILCALNKKFDIEIQWRLDITKGYVNK